MTAPASHLVLLPTYNTGPRLRDVVAEVLAHWPRVLVVVDGSTDGSAEALRAVATENTGLAVLVLPRNSGKGAAVLAGASWARERGFTHALAMDADGQHPAASIREFMAASQRAPDAMVLGRPIFPPNIPAERLHGRKLSVALVRGEILGPGIDDPLFGFRVYPLAPLVSVLGPRRSGRRYDFDTEAAVRLFWAGVPALNLAAPVRYFSRAEGGVSHFHYVRDNVGLVRLHVRLIAELLLRRWPAVLRHRRRRARGSAAEPPPTRGAAAAGRTRAVLWSSANPRKKGLRRRLVAVFMTQRPRPARGAGLHPASGPVEKSPAMHNRLRLLVGLCLTGLLHLGAAPASTGYFEAVKTAPAPVVGQEYYLRHCIMHEKGTHVGTNYWRGELTPINTKVKLVSLAGKTMVLQVDGSGQTVKVENVPEYTKCDIQAIAARMLSPTPIALDQFGPAVADAIRHGTMKTGMTKEQVVMARGYPPAHKTPSLEQDRWQYWSSRFVVQTIVFADGVLTQGRGIE